MATEPLDVDLHGVFRSRYDFIRNGIQICLGDLASKLYARGLIDLNTMQTATNPSSPTGDRATAVMLVLDAKIKTAPCDIYQLLGVLGELSVLNAVAIDLRQNLPLLQGQQQQASRPRHLEEIRVGPPAQGRLPDLTGKSAVYVTGNLHRSTLPPPTASLTPPEPPNLNELMEGYGIEAEAHERVCSDAFLAEVAEMIGDAGLQCAHLNYCPPETSPHDTPLLLLKRWKERYAYKATLKTLAQCLWSAGRHDLVNGLCLSLSSTHHRPTSLPERATPGPRVEAGRTAGHHQPPASSDTAQSYPASFMPTKASPPTERVLVTVTTPTPRLPRGPIGDCTPLASDIASPASDIMSPESDDTSPAGRDAFVPLQATMPTMEFLRAMPSRSDSTDSNASIGSCDTFHSCRSTLSLSDAFPSLSLSETDGSDDESLFKSAKMQLQKLQLRMSRKDKAISLQERELKDTITKLNKADERVKDLQEKLAKKDRELREKAQQAVAGSPSQMASLQKHLDITNRYLEHVEKERDRLQQEVSHGQDKLKAVTKESKQQKKELDQIWQDLVKARTDSYYGEVENDWLRRRVKELEDQVEMFLVTHTRRHSV